MAIFRNLKKCHLTSNWRYKIYDLIYVLAEKDECEISVSDRQECGFAGIAPWMCEARGCCFDSSTSGAIWCFKKSSKMGKI